MQIHRAPKSLSTQETIPQCTLAAGPQTRDIHVGRARRMISHFGPGRRTESVSLTWFASTRNPLTAKKNQARLEERIKKSATAFINQPSPANGKAYKEALGARSLFERKHTGSIGKTAVMSNPVAGNRVYELGVRTERQALWPDSAEGA
ncbi:MAG: hypothetical protein JWP91_4109 [Fibrobacteres bacterium]|nr:hypothetical protein [Fibrobacterota bacterium]